MEHTPTNPAPKRPPYREDIDTLHFLAESEVPLPSSISHPVGINSLPSSCPKSYIDGDEDEYNAANNESDRLRAALGESGSQRVADATLLGAAQALDVVLRRPLIRPLSVDEYIGRLIGCESYDVSRTTQALNTAQYKILIYIIHRVITGNLVLTQWTLRENMSLARVLSGHSESHNVRFAINAREHIQLQSAPVCAIHPCGDDSAPIGAMNVFMTQSGYAVTFCYRRGDERFNDIAGCLLALLDQYNIYRGQTITPNFDFVDTSSASWSDLFLNAGMTAEIIGRIVATFKLEDILIANGSAAKSGMIFSGPPGTGKTQFIRCLCNHFCGQITFVWVTPSDITWSRSIREIYEIARDLAPAIPVFEDADIYLAQRSQGGSSDNTTGEMMQCMDGLVPLRGVVTILTSNQPHVLERALGDRPGRFDVTYEFGPQGRDARHAFVNKLFAGTGLLPADIDWVTDQTNGMTPATIKHKLYDYAVVIAALAGDFDTQTKRVKLTRRTIEEAVTRAERRHPIMASGDDHYNSTSADRANGGQDDYDDDDAMEESIVAVPRTRPPLKSFFAGVKSHE